MNGMLSMESLTLKVVYIADVIGVKMPSPGDCGSCYITERNLDLSVRILTSRLADNEGLGTLDMDCDTL